MRKTAQIITLGCPKNEVDSEVAGKVLTDAGFSVASDQDMPNVVFINTCGFIDDAKKESIEQIEEALERKKSGEIEQVCVAGCLVKRCEEELSEKFNDVDHFFSVTDFKKINEVYGSACWKNDRFDRAKLTSSHFAYLKISEGCDLKCSFCAIPSIRGPMQSRTVESLVDEAGTLADAGTRELVVIAEDTTRYGNDLRNGSDLCTLLERLEDVSGIEWIRLMYAYPGSVSDRLIELISGSEKICSYLDMPIQHISDRVLDRMNRTYRRRHVEKLVSELRRKVPGITLRTTVITGFPGEKDEDFIELSDFLSDIQFERLGLFRYSDEEGTAAEKLDGKNSFEVISERFDELTLNHDEFLEEKNETFVGTRIKVLVDGQDEETGDYIARTEGDAPEIDLSVRIRRAAEKGEFTEISVEETSAFELSGK